MAVLALDHDPRVLPALGVVHGQDDDAAVVADDVALVLVAAGLDDLVVADAEERALVDDFRADELRALGHDDGLEAPGALLVCFLLGFLLFGVLELGGFGGLGFHYLCGLGLFGGFGGFCCLGL